MVNPWKPVEKDFHTHTPKKKRKPKLRYRTHTHSPKHTHSSAPTHTRRLQQEQKIVGPKGKWWLIVPSESPGSSGKTKPKKPKQPTTQKHRRLFAIIALDSRSILHIFHSFRKWVAVRSFSFINHHHLNQNAFLFFSGTIPLPCSLNRGSFYSYDKFIPICNTAASVIEEHSFLSSQTIEFCNVSSSKNIFKPLIQTSTLVPSFLLVSI